MARDQVAPVKPDFIPDILLSDLLGSQTSCGHVMQVGDPVILMPRSAGGVRLISCWTCGAPQLIKRWHEYQQALQEWRAAVEQG